MSKKIELLSKNLQKAWDNTCSDCKNLLENLHPDYVFKKEIEYDPDKIYGFVQGDDIGMIVEAGDGRHSIVYLESDRYWDDQSWGEGQQALSYLSTADNVKIEVFDNQKDFFTWALKQIKQ